MPIFCSGKKTPSLRALASLCLNLLVATCGQKSQVDCKTASAKSHCVAKTPDEQAVELLNSGDYPAAITLLEKLISEESDTSPEKYFRQVRLSSAYAGLAGYDVFAIIEGMAKNDTSVLSTDATITDEALTSLQTELGLLSSALEPLKMVFATLPYPKADDSEEFKSKYFFLPSAQFQQSIYSAIQVNKCNGIYTFISASPLERRKLLNDFPSCGFSQTMENLSSFISSFSDLAESCTKCQTALEKFKDKQAEFNEALKGLEEAGDSEKVDKIILDACIKKNRDPALCQIPAS